MQKIIITLIIALLFGTAAIAQNRRLAVFEPSGALASNMNELVREEITSAMSSVRGFTLLERHLIDLTLQENRFRPGADAQIIEMGRIMRADFVLLTNVERAGSNFSISFRLLEVRTERALRQRTAQTRQGLHDMTETIQRTLSEMFATSVTSTAVLPQGALFAQRRTVYLLEREIIEDEIKDHIWHNRLKKLSRDEVQSLMANNDALEMFNKGVRQNRAGNILLFSGIAAIAGSVVIASVLPNDIEVRHEYTGNDGNQYYKYEWERVPNPYTPILAGAGAISIIVGLAIKSESKLNIGKSVNAYNSSRRFSNAGLNFDFTGNGARLTLNF